MEISADTDDDGLYQVVTVAKYWSSAILENHAKTKTLGFLLFTVRLEIYKKI